MTTDHHAKRLAGGAVSPEAIQLLPPAEQLHYYRNISGNKVKSEIRNPKSEIYLTLTHCFFLALASTASHTFCVSSASRNVGPAGLPVSKPFRKSAT